MSVSAKPQGHWTYWIDVSEAESGGAQHSWEVTKVHSPQPETAVPVAKGMAESVDRAERDAQDARDAAMRASREEEVAEKRPDA